MYFPFLTTRSSNSGKAGRKLYRRRGGGGGGKGGGSSGSGKGSSGGSSGSSVSAGRSSSISAGGTSRQATAFGNGGGKSITIPSGQLFAGRSEGGGTRSQVFGTSTYGSGYPGISGRGVAGRGFPFFFWPIAWGGVAGAGSAAYLHDTEYGRPDNTSRPGGPIMTSTFTSNSSNTTFHVISDNSTVVELITDIISNCSSFLNSSTTSTSPIPYNDTDPNSPQPESTIQYYRASSVALTLDGYNNTAALGNDSNAPATPLPSNIDTTLEDCLNQTIGAAVPLVDGASIRWSVPNVGALALLLIMCHTLSALVV